MENNNRSRLKRIEKQSIPILSKQKQKELLDLLNKDEEDLHLMAKAMLHNCLKVGKKQYRRILQSKINNILRERKIRLKRKSEYMGNFIGYSTVLLKNPITNYVISTN